ncbi:hypothetical protein GCM10008957_23350 [Deinococcus ruber]|uniref:Uncharacterized protein n=1 Tax=Deinococcus ruber TaxID=1848197 RepID=A0A918F5I9_9DEIO|nr:hypothetical protein GCM10008957_23350 [Deinococcus ruber]
MIPEYDSLTDALKPVPLQRGRTFIPVDKREVQADEIGDFWWRLPERFVDRSHYPGLHNVRFSLYTFCRFVLDEDDFLYITLRVSEFGTRVVARTRTWPEAQRAHDEYHFQILDHPTEFGFDFEEIHPINLQRLRPH